MLRSFRPLHNLDYQTWSPVRAFIDKRMIVWGERKCARVKMLWNKNKSKNNSLRRNNITMRLR